MKANKQFFRFTLLLTLAILQLACSPSKDKDPNDEAVQNDFPSMTAMSMVGTELKLRDLTGRVVLILFQTDCDHCQREAAAIQENISAFKDYSLYFISTTSPEDILKFADHYKLIGHQNVHFFRTSSQSILENFGPIDAPSLYIYSDKKLVKAFNGETNINEILKYI